MVIDTDCISSCKSNYENDTGDPPSKLLMEGDCCNGEMSFLLHGHLFILESCVFFVIYFKMCIESLVLYLVWSSPGQIKLKTKLLFVASLLSTQY